jgi:hypothetical protein
MARKSVGTPVEEFVKQGNYAAAEERLESLINELNAYVVRLQTRGWTIVPILRTDQGIPPKTFDVIITRPEPDAPDAA